MGLHLIGEGAGATLAGHFYSKQDDGTVYSRESCQYLTFDQAIDEFAHSLNDAGDINVPTAQPKWISVHDMIPGQEIDVLGCDGNGNIGIIQFHEDNKPYELQGGYWNEVDVWYWMPLPEAPKEET